MVAHHEPFKALSPLEWDAVDGHEDLSELLSDTFNHAQVLIDSIPIPTTAAVTPLSNSSSLSATTGRARSQTESAVKAPTLRSASADTRHSAPQNTSSSVTATDPATVAKLQKEWKEVKVNAKDNPLGISVYKLSAKDGKGAWFARRSLHHGLSFDKWKLALEKEFAETLARCGPDGQPGSGNIRGIGAEKRVERKVVEGKGALELFHVSARFPGPTTPRDFVPLLLMSADSFSGTAKSSGTKRQPRQFMLVSRPCAHPECPPRQGFIRGQYESVEVIREVPLEKPAPLRRARSSVDLTREELKPESLDGTMAKEAVLRSANRAAAAAAAAADEDPDEPEMAIEWFMVTRSDPGGSVPRFMVEKGTPGGITNDAGRFLKWLATKEIDDLKTTVDAVDLSPQQRSQTDVPASSSTDKKAQSKSTATTATTQQSPINNTTESRQQAESPPSGFYGMIAGALGVAGSVVANRVAAFAGSAMGTDDEDYNAAAAAADAETTTDDDSDDDDSLSNHSYVSAEEGDKSVSVSAASASVADLTSIRSVRSGLSENSQTPATAPTTSSSAANAQHEKELKKLQARRHKLQEKMERARERASSKARRDNETNTDKDAQALAKLREKHGRDMARQEEKFQRDMRRLEEKRRHEEKRAEERKRKAVERQEKANVQMELERLRAERDVARKEIELLKGQVGELQAQNTMLVARLGKLGVGQADV
ncbi:hypothetical protein B0T17DRAFT_494206 [Bombardia bombarda]|uniref:DUF3074 domain-containing protein n=1 Tax=Bombardia bombarda TaxID=252184 RepID=A0AA40C1T1_9PEZI|nr:hypothetical protein B0T17DRAFT_494206 [Bombardia bombarda]